MQTNRTVIILGITTLVEVEPGVWEEKVTEHTVRAAVERIYQRRRDQAMADGQPITGRFRFRWDRLPENLDYLTHNRRRFKVRSVTEDPVGHWWIVETGELL